MLKLLADNDLVVEDSRDFKTTKNKKQRHNCQV